MRSNGLTAAAYAPVADLDPMLAASLLEDLRAQGVAAYTTPVGSSSVAGFDRLEFRSSVKDRLYVDANASARARQLISEHDPALLDDNDDLAWAQLVAGFDRPYDEPVAPWPVVEDIAPRTPDADEPPAPGEGRRKTDHLPFRSHLPAYEPPEPVGEEQRPDPADTDEYVASAAARRAAADAEPDPDRFVPDPPPPLPRLAPYKQIAWVGLIAGPLILILSVLIGFTPPGWVLFFCVLGFVGGFITLVATMGDGDWGSGDGAVV